MKSKTLKRFVVVALACGGLTCATPTMAQDKDYTVITPSNNSCGSWTQFRSVRAATPYGYWALGFLSGSNLNIGEVDFLKGRDADGIYAWIDNYCKANPLEKVTEAVANLAAELYQRAKKRQ
jgi:hypothetical protein